MSTISKILLFFFAFGTLGGRFVYSQGVCLDAKLPSKVRDNTVGRGVFEGDTKWDTGSTLRIKFLDGNDDIQQRVIFYANQWMRYANIKFEWVRDEKAEIRISFAGNGSFSHIGRNALKIRSQDQATMNLDIADAISNEALIRRTVLHEFGHALCLVHEHQNPNSRLIFKEDAVYAYYMESQGWTRDEIKSNIIDSYSVGHTNMKYDSRSIMHYPIPARLTWNGIDVPWNTVLSEGDRELVKKLYPMSIEPRSSSIKVSRFTIDVKLNAVENNVSGISIYPKFQIDNARGSTIRAVAYFFFENGSKLKDSNSLYKADDGQVAVGENLSPGFATTVFNFSTNDDFRLFIPDSELHLRRNIRHHVKFYVVIWHDHVSIGRSDWHSFTSFSGSKERIIFKNSTGQDLYVAIDYMNLEGKWGGPKYWFRIAPRERAYLEDTRNKLIYYYAYTADGRWVWKGNDTFNVIGGTRYGFRQCDLSGQSGDLVVDIE